MIKQAFVLLSGGLDSTVLATLAAKHFKPKNVTAVSLHYGQRHSKELDAADEIAKHLGIHHIEREVVSIGKGGLTDPSQEIPTVDYSDLKGVSPSYVPFRNGLMLSTLASIASSREILDTLGFDDEVYIGYGAHAEDSANWAYPDCTPEFIGAMAAAIYVGTYHKVRLWTPLMHMEKFEVVMAGDNLEAPMHLSWSCYEGRKLQCGICPTCRARKTAFRVANVEDPTEYMV